MCDRKEDIYHAIVSRRRIQLRELTLALFSDCRYTTHDTSRLPRSYRGVIATLRRNYLCHKGNRMHRYHLPCVFVTHPEKGGGTASRSPFSGSSESCVGACLTAIRNIAGNVYKFALILAKRTFLGRDVSLYGIATFLAFPFAHYFSLLVFSLGCRIRRCRKCTLSQFLIQQK
jgi:hypothetical protein